MQPVRASGMRYTEEQVSMLERLEHGLVWEWGKDLETDDILHFLDEEGLLKPREDVERHLLTLSQRGKIALESLRSQSGPDCQKETGGKEGSRNGSEVASHSVKQKRNKLFQAVAGVVGTAVTAFVVEQLTGLLSYVFGLLFG